MPPVALSEVLNDWVAIPPDKLVVLMVNGAAAAAIDSARVALALRAGEAASFTVTPMLKLPLAVGVPEITPVAGASVSPEGRAPEVTDQA